ncbi:hypothetical protein LTR53_020333, partial [Teratosphaeriaceae sp. CCFEE 6253]
MVDRETWQVMGYVDWAEAEYLPFGLCQYGIEHLLGYLDHVEGKPRFVWYQQAGQLRAIFWRALGTKVPALATEEICHGLNVARHVGIFLWHGFAW